MYSHLMLLYRAPLEIIKSPIVFGLSLRVAQTPDANSSGPDRVTCVRAPRVTISILIIIVNSSNDNSQ